MKKEKFLNIIKFYNETNKLKEVERTGWNIWKISRDKRVESIAEHIYGTQQLAIAIFSEFDLKIDIYKVITMLSLHETEEIHIGDITPYDGISREEKRKMGAKAVEKTFVDLHKKDMFIDLINEFVYNYFAFLKSIENTQFFCEFFFTEVYFRIVST